MDSETSRLLRKANDYRNLLLHRFLAEHAIDLLNAGGCAKVNDKLEHIYTTLRRANWVVLQMCKHIFTRLGLEPEDVERKVAEYHGVARQTPDIRLDDHNC
jgi:hypothetical protein